MLIHQVVLNLQSKASTVLMYKFKVTGDLKCPMDTLSGLSGPGVGVVLPLPTDSIYWSAY